MAMQYSENIPYILRDWNFCRTSLDFSCNQLLQPTLTHSCNFKLCTLLCLRPRGVDAYHAQKAANTEVESSYLKSTMKVESIHYGDWLVNNDVCFLCQLGSVGARDLIPCKTLLKISVWYPISSPCDAFCCCSLKTDTTIQPFVGTDTHSQREHIHKITHTITHTKSHTQNQSHTCSHT